MDVQACVGKGLEHNEKIQMLERDNVDRKKETL